MVPLSILQSCRSQEALLAACRAELEATTRQLQVRLAPIQHHTHVLEIGMSTALHAMLVSCDTVSYDMQPRLPYAERFTMIQAVVHDVTERTVLVPPIQQG